MGQKSSKKQQQQPVVTVSDSDTAALSHLPQELVWHCKKALDKKEKWEFTGNEYIGYFCKEFTRSSPEYNKVQQLFKQLGGEALPIKKIWGIYNPTVYGIFANNHRIMEEETAEEPWNSTWKDDDPEGLRQSIFDTYNSHVTAHDWNENLEVPVLPVLHGTGMKVAREIAKTGFAALSSLDSGYFGKGIYFTSSASYTLPYATLDNRTDPAIIISYVVPGNIYPTSEQHKGPESLAGKPLRTPGYNSHYVLTKKTGFAVETKGEIPVYDEIVVPEEAQVAPAFIIELENSQELKTQQEMFERDFVVPNS